MNCSLKAVKSIKKYAKPIKALLTILNNQQNIFPEIEKENYLR
jgi:hypothetical protein